MLFRYAHIEESLGEMLPESGKPGAVCHRGRNRDDIFVFAAELTDLGRKYFGVGPAVLYRCTAAGRTVKRSDSVICRRVVLGIFVAFALLGDNMYQHRPCELCRTFKGVQHQVDIVAVDRTDVGHAHVLKEHTGNHQRFDRILGFLDGADDLGTDNGDAV